jgi:amino acid transporter
VFLRYVNRRPVPVAILIAQGALGSLFALAFLFVPSINTSYWMLSALTTQIIVLKYIMVFAAALRLRYTEPDTPRPSTVPGAKIGIWAVAGLGLIGSGLGLIIGFIPPAGIDRWPTPVYVAAMIVAIAICSVPPFIVEQVKKPSWNIADPDVVLLDVDERLSRSPWNFAVAIR